VKTIRNTTMRPIKVPLPRGKVLHLGPRKTGEVAINAVEHPPLAKLVEAGDLEIVGDGSHADPGQSTSGSIRASNRGKHSAANIQRRGDR
jgi:hypothetical protein